MSNKNEQQKRAPRETTAARQASILAGALRCFDELGIDGTTISDIQKETKCSVGSLYHHFGNKEGIAEELFIEGIQQFNTGMIRKLKRSTTAEERVKSVVRFYCDWTARNRALARYLHSRNIEFSEEARARLRQIHELYINQVFQLFTDHVLSGEMRALPLDTYVPLISGPVQEFTRRWLSGQSGSGSSISREMKELFADAAWKVVKT
ncbi:MAG: TetR/AcrR family transcriptional regulator [Gammaproteobacteria bacterium]|mgnify:CR=1 FL=1|jgi:AcrR family transcriptional regulator|nr:TetR/AcrR family transcriptional regulator [Gammaproteobacteria bacterium]MBT4491670.1 TetR/AcrR family transcriptional regulator [Gammaproteobacteria bacterium]MBT7370773.1 TetR/AcrR family transcriptional regulator [Gammaproteobacteria bacterium]